jgi:hypothetical protein
MAQQTANSFIVRVDYHAFSNSFFGFFIHGNGGKNGA